MANIQIKKLLIVMGVFQILTGGWAHLLANPNMQIKNTDRCKL